MYRLAVCDDEPLFMEALRAMAAAVLGEAGIAHEITALSRADALVSRLREQPNCFDTLMLDILLDEDNGVELARTLRGAGYQGAILFVTSSKDYALEGYSVHPIHYLLKPIKRDALKQTLLRDYRQRFQPPMLSIPVKGGLSPIPLDTILYIESLQRALIVHTKDRDIETALPLREIREMLPHGAFLQCHKSFLVAMGQIRNITRSEILLHTGQRLPMGRVFYAEALTAFIDYMADSYQRQTPAQPSLPAPPMEESCER